MKKLLKQGIPPNNSYNKILQSEAPEKMQVSDSKLNCRKIDIMPIKCYTVSVKKI